MLDVFPRYTVVIAITRSGGDVASGLIEGLNKFDKSPQTIYSDDEKALSTEADEKKKTFNGLTTVLKYVSLINIKCFIRAPDTHTKRGTEGKKSKSQGENVNGCCQNP